MAKTYIIRNQGKGTLTNIDPVDLIDISGEGGAGDGGSSVDTNFANTDLIATDNRTHDFANNILEINNLYEFKAIVTNEWSIGRDDIAIFKYTGGEAGETIGILNQKIGNPPVRLEVSENSASITNGKLDDTLSTFINVGRDIVNSYVTKIGSSIKTGITIQDDLLYLESGLFGATSTKIELTPANISLELPDSLKINGDVGTAGQVITSQGTGLPPIWANSGGSGTVPTLQQVVAAGNITTQDIAISAAALQFNNPGGDKYIYGNQLVGIPSPVTIFQLPDVGGIIPVSVNGITADDNGNIELTSGLTPTLQEVCDAGNGTTQNIRLLGSNVFFEYSEGFYKSIVGNLISGIDGNYTVELPDASGVFVLSVNGTPPDNNGNVELSGLSLQNLINLIPQTASYILLDTDFDITQDNSIEMDVATANTLNINATLLASVPIGGKINVVQYGVGQTQITVAGGAVLLSAGGADKIANRYGAATIVKRSATEFYLFGDIVA
jgi:hypothetical protein